MIARLLILPFGSIWRLKQRCIDTRNPLLKKLAIALYGLYQYENNSAIAWNATFAGIPCLPHGMKSIFISGGAKIGRNCVIFQQVTIGSNTLPDSKGTGAPRVGDDCYIGAGAKIIGKVRVGNNVRISANAVVYKDVPDNTVVLAGEQRLISKDAPPDNRYYTYRGRWVAYDNGHWVPVQDPAILAKLNR